MDRFTRTHGGRAACAAVASIIALLASGAVGSAAAPAAVSQLGRDDWTMFHHDPGHLGISTAKAVGATAATAGLTLSWKVSAGSMIEASPAVVYNTALGKTLVYIQTWNNLLLALDANTGATVWSYTEPGSLGADSSPAVYGNTVYVGTVGAHTLFAVDATTGQLDCSFATSGRVVSAPLVADVGSGPEVFFGDTGLHEKQNFGHEWAITGVGNTAGQCHLIWSYDSWGVTNGGKLTGSWSPPALANDRNQRPLLVFGSSQPDNAVYALDARTGARVWMYRTASTGDLDVGAGAAITAPGIDGFADGEVYIDGKNGTMYALDLMTGAVTWSFDMSAHLGGVLRTSVSTPAVVHGTVYVAFAFGMWSFDAITGIENWYTGTANPVGKIVSSPAIAGAPGDRVIYSNDVGGAITAYGAKDGRILWQHSTGQTLYGSDAVSDSKVFFGGFDGNVYAFG